MIARTVVDPSFESSETRRRHLLTSHPPSEQITPPSGGDVPPANTHEISPNKNKELRCTSG